MEGRKERKRQKETRKRRKEGFESITQNIYLEEHLERSFSLKRF